MGGKPSWTRECVYLCFAMLTLIAAAGCAPRGARPPAFRLLMDDGDFEGAAKKSEELLGASPQCRQADEALFTLGLVYAHLDNPKKDYRKSLGYFVRLRKEHPESPLAGEAKIWIGVLETIEKDKQVDLEIDEKKKGLDR